MKNYRQLSLLLVGLMMIPAIVGSVEAGLTVYAQMSRQYEAIRLSLLSDTVEGLKENARTIQEQAAALREGFSAAEAGVPEEKAGELDSVLQEIEAVAAQLAEAPNLDAAREGFFTMTKPMAKYRKLAGDDHTVVAYCSMAQKAWIQPEGEIGNPYMGQNMPKCGEVVSE